MDQTTFSNKWYPILLVSSLLFALTTRIIKFIGEEDIVSLVHILLTALVIILLISNNSLADKGVKVWAAIAILGGFLGLTSILLYCLIGRQGEVESLKIIKHSLHLIIGIILFKYWNKSLG